MKFKSFKILQLKKDIPDRHYKIFEPYDRLVKHFGKVNIDEYECVYSDFGADNITLEKIYRYFNYNPHPEGYRGHSLSVSDIVVLDGKYYYCNDIGWKELTL